MARAKILIWYRNDLRVTDNQLLASAIEREAEIFPFYCFDPRQFATTSFGFPKTGKFRAQFLLETIADLRLSLQKLGSNLIVRQGLPEKIIPDFVRAYQIDLVYFHQEVTSEELSVENTLKTNLSRIGVRSESFWGSTLYHPQDLPFSLDRLPELFTNFRQQVEAKSLIRDCFASPTKLPPLIDLEFGSLPNLQQLVDQLPQFDNRAVLKFLGGETTGKQRLQDYFWHTNSLQSYKQTRNGMLGADYSSKFSPWLANGSLSPRWIYREVQKYEQQIVKNDSTYWLVFELLWRDFFRFISLKHANKIFYRSGLQGLNIDWQEDWSKFSLWQEGKTGYPLIDANMRELATTGFMSNRGRQNVASFLTKNLGINWQMGAEWFESLLLDYDVCSNYGNWNYTAGIGNDARGFRYFNTIKQAKDYDPRGEYVRHWLPELANIPGDKIHQPWQLSLPEQKKYSVIIGLDYPRPMVEFFKSISTNQAIYQKFN
jgi:deoxyribodipyrimidine photo-lyase